MPQCTSHVKEKKNHTLKSATNFHSFVDFFKINFPFEKRSPLILILSPFRASPRRPSRKRLSTRRQRWRQHGKIPPQPPGTQRIFQGLRKRTRRHDVTAQAWTAQRHSGAWYASSSSVTLPVSTGFVLSKHGAPAPVAALPTRCYLFFRAQSSTAPVPVYLEWSSSTDSVLGIALGAEFPEFFPPGSWFDSEHGPQLAAQCATSICCRSLHVPWISTTSWNGQWFDDFT